MVPIVAFIGWHNSGKTTLAVRVVKHLKEHGYLVAVIKSSKETGITFDHVDTDTARYRRAGADAVTFIAPDQMVMMTAAPVMSLVNLVQRFFSHVDIVIAEGFKDEPHIAKIEVTRAADDLLRDRVNGVIALATDRTMNGDNVFRLEQSREIANFIEKRFLENSADRKEPAARVFHQENKIKPPLCRLQKNKKILQSI
ncbi:MAG: molybdopterin-guanine dinucleotide biosynthesis protein B [Deltaproteobacteria bacterium]|nr:molybdopterin-guanine dinucleotide biosynthesis protein B [Deltaproteobacteria bacterium]